MDVVWIVIALIYLGLSLFSIARISRIRAMRLIAEEPINIPKRRKMTTRAITIPTMIVSIYSLWHIITGEYVAFVGFFMVPILLHVYSLDIYLSISGIYSNGILYPYRFYPKTSIRGWSIVQEEVISIKLENGKKKKIYIRDLDAVTIEWLNSCSTSGNA